MEEEFERAVATVAALADDLRRRMYLFIRTQGRPVGRDEAAAEAGISRKLAAFHLDKLVEKGLLTAHYARPSGRGGPGAGRPSKLYEPARDEVAVTLPSRSYDFVGKILIRALERPARRGSAVDAVREVAAEAGLELGRKVRRAKRMRSVSEERALAVAGSVLYDRGYEPYPAEGGIRLRNCPFHALAKTSVELVCGMNQAYIEGLLEGLGTGEVDAVLDPRPGECCVRLAPRTSAA